MKCQCHCERTNSILVNLQHCDEKGQRFASNSILNTKFHVNLPTYIAAMFQSLYDMQNLIIKFDSRLFYASFSAFTLQIWLRLLCFLKLKLKWMCENKIIVKNRRIMSYSRGHMRERSNKKCVFIRIQHKESNQPNI